MVHGVMWRAEIALCEVVHIVLNIIVMYDGIVY